MDILYRIKNLEPFKDGQILGSKVLKINEVLVIDENVYKKLMQSGAALEVIERVVKNPLKDVVARAAEVQEVVSAVEKEKAEVVMEAVPAKKKPGRPKKHVEN